MKTKFHVLALGLIFFGVATRLIPHPANVTAIGALALWSTTLFRSRSVAILLPLLTLFVTDLILGFHSTVLWVYGAFACIGVLSIWLEPRVSWARTFAGSVIASLLFFGLTNFGVWLTGELYPMTSQGLEECYLMGVPFLRNQVWGDLLYSGVLGIAARALASHRELAYQRP